VALDDSDDRSGDFDLVLLAEAFLDKPFATPIGFGYVELVPGLAAASQPNDENGAYDFDASGTPNDAAGAVVAQAVIVDVLLEDARALNNLLDGAGLGEDNGGNDFNGRVKYPKPAPAKKDKKKGKEGSGKAWAWGHHRDNTVDIYIYLTHK